MFNFSAELSGFSQFKYPFTQAKTSPKANIPTNNKISMTAYMGNSGATMESSLFFNKVAVGNKKTNSISNSTKVAQSHRSVD